ncbi:hypothetical protein BKD09_14880 [Bradyrhizobium japonicum]|uniref:Uncharacterized protein n=1 Tax=Bradyrhizobium japonicum TaxID=375 RepID=A0A1L3F8I3_BRAJP|nr:hypothetical protein BKD09_14880 [Bradyrhizobium japonicum]
MKVIRVAIVMAIVIPVPPSLKAEEGAEAEVVVAAAGPLVAQAAQPLQLREALARLLLPQAREVAPPARQIRPGQPQA